MHFLHRALSSDLGRHRYQIRTLYDGVSSMKWPRDRGLDHTVSRESHLKPLLNLKSLIISEPSKSIPLSLITQSKNQTLDFPFRPIEFIRKYPSVFEEFHPASLNIQPHIKLTPEVISLSSEEDLFYQTVDYKQDIAGRLLKLLMISRVNKVPLFLLEKLKWELGLPRDYENIVIPEFPDFFRVVGGGKELELVCWSDEFAVSEMEKKMKGEKDGNIQFNLQYSKDFEMDKKYKKWVDDWQKLPYVSPYQNAMHLGAKTDESDKWAVSVLHEVLSLCVGKKAERENLLYLGEYLGLRSRFKLAFLQHPGIFYVSTKIGTHTVVLKEAYKRGMLIEKHPLMNMRSKYIQLMNVMKSDDKSKSTQKKSRNRVDAKKDEEEEAEDGDSEDEKDVEMSNDNESDDSEEEDEEEEEEEEEDDDEGEKEKRQKFERHRANFEERNSGKRTKENEYTPTRISRRNNTRDDPNNYGSSTRFSSRTNTRGDPTKYASSDRFSKRPNNHGDSRKMYNRGDSNEDRFSRKNNTRGGANEHNTSMRSSRRTNSYGDSNEHSSSTNSFRRMNTRGDSNEHSRFSKRTNARGDSNVPRRAPRKSDDVSGNRPRSRTDRTRT